MEVVVLDPGEQTFRAGFAQGYPCEGLEEPRVRTRCAVQSVGSEQHTQGEHQLPSYAAVPKLLCAVAGHAMHVWRTRPRNLIIQMTLHCGTIDCALNACCRSGEQGQDLQLGGSGVSCPSQPVRLAWLGAGSGGRRGGIRAVSDPKTKNAHPPSPSYLISD